MIALATGLAAAAAPGMTRAATTLSASDIAWLRRDGYALDNAALTHYQQLGRTHYLDWQLAGNDVLQDAVAAKITGYEALRTPPAQLLLDYRQQMRQIKAMPDGDAKTAAKKQLQKRSRGLVDQAQQIVLLHAIYGSNQLKEQLVWFWLNHFSIYGVKGRTRLVAADYAEHVIRPHALGKFRDLVMATLKSPAMLEFLDNDKNAKGKVNENYARELMELHTLGVGSGYTQQDVQQLALVLTGVGIAPPRLADRPLPRRYAAAGAVHEGLFAFMPQRHDFSDKTLLGQHIAGDGFTEVEQAVDLITRQPACAHFISAKLATYFLADDPPPAVVDAMAATFQRTDGDIAAVLRTLFTSKPMADPTTKKFKDPNRFVVSAMRLAYADTPVTNAQPLVNWLKQLSEPTFGRITPDGWSLDSASWTGSGQMSRRFDIAAAIGNGRNRLFVADTDDDPASTDGMSAPAQTAALPVPRGTPPDLKAPPYPQTFATRLAPGTRQALAKAKSPQEWNTFLLSSPDFNYR